MPIPVAVGAVMAGAGIANSILGKKKKASVDVAGMTRDTNSGVTNQTGIVGNQSEALKALNPAYAAGMNKLGTDYTNTSTGIANDYQRNLAGVDAIDAQAAEKAKALNQVQAARTLPLNQMLMRQNLAASGGMRTGAAGKTLNAPVMQNAQQQSDFSKTLDIKNLEAKSARTEKGVDTLYSSSAGAALEKFGLDRDTMNTLLANNRSDIILQAAQLLGIDQQRVANMLGIRGIQANQSIANAGMYNNAQNSLNSALIGGGTQLMAAAKK